MNPKRYHVCLNPACTEPCIRPDLRDEIRTILLDGGIGNLATHLVKFVNEKRNPDELEHLFYIGVSVFHLDYKKDLLELVAMLRNEAGSVYPEVDHLLLEAVANAGEYALELSRKDVEQLGAEVRSTDPAPYSAESMVNAFRARRILRMASQTALGSLSSILSRPSAFDHQEPTDEGQPPPSKKGLH